ncbi:hypothetical protein K8P03_08560 [Anaerococcus murdochii]|uniref:Uncharacterized protein n=1 Tax=Anaerococcus murdochii TaxID=411577 RepID=A0ABS7T0M8_9FIRM|nr:hypothetical protein [Anaerococcus murdochii]MBZ2387332.1 hypothetical protein [Anaerococcus murdochii]
MSYYEVRANVYQLISENYEDYIKSLISIEKNINNEDCLNSIYNEFMNDNNAVSIFDADIDGYIEKLGIDLEDEKVIHGEPISYEEEQEREIDREKFYKDDYESLKADLDDVSYSLYENLLSENSGCLTDKISEIADYAVDVYSSDLYRSLPKLANSGYYDRVAEEFGLSGDLDRDIMSAQYLRNTDDLYENLDDIVRNVAISIAKDYELPLTEGIEEALNNIGDCSSYDSIEPILDELKDTIGYEAQEIAKDKLISEGIDLDDFIEEYLEEINVYELDSNQNMMDLINDKVDEIKESLGINKDINR